MTKETLGTFLKEIEKRHKTDSGIEMYPEWQFYFRGQAQIGSPEWTISPSIFRNGRKEIENKIYDAAMTECPQDFLSCRNHCEILSTMQHYGIPTRLVDITKNALVALYFAIVNEKGSIVDKEDGVVFIIGVPKSKIKTYDSDTISILASLPRFKNKDKNNIRLLAIDAINSHRGDLDNQVKAFNGTLCENKKISKEVQKLLHEIKKEKPQFEHLINPNHILDNFIFTPQKTNPRIIRQDGAFIIFGLGYEGKCSQNSLPGKEILDKNMIFDENYKQHTPYIISKVKIARRAKKRILQELKYCGISQSSLFPELYKLGEYIRIHNDIP